MIRMATLPNRFGTADMGMYRQHLQLKLAEYGIDAATYRER